MKQYCFAVWLTSVCIFVNFQLDCEGRGQCLSHLAPPGAWTQETLDQPTAGRLADPLEREAAGRKIFGASALQGKPFCSRPSLLHESSLRSSETPLPRQAESSRGGTSGPARECLPARGGSPAPGPDRSRRVSGTCLPSGFLSAPPPPRAAGRGRPGRDGRVGTPRAGRGRTGTPGLREGTRIGGRGTGAALRAAVRGWGGRHRGPWGRRGPEKGRRVAGDTVQEASRRRAVPLGVSRHLADCLWGWHELARVDFQERLERREAVLLWGS